MGKGFALIMSIVDLLLVFSHAKAQTPYSYADPFIGTTRSGSVTRWGSEGGCYPGAVAPWGFVQLSPETRAGGSGGYDYADSIIYYFSCFHHHSGFPGGSAGSVFVMPLRGGQGGMTDSFRTGFSSRPFSHSNEVAEPGYYSVAFTDDRTRVEATVSEKTGIFRFQFLPGMRPRIFVGGMGKILTAQSAIYGENGGTGRGRRGFNTVMHFSENPVAQVKSGDGLVLEFAPSAPGTGAGRVILLRLSASMVDREGAEGNLRAESRDFDRMRAESRRHWTELLSVIGVRDENEENKKIFYTALYHALLLPWIVSDADGHYRGADRRVHSVSGRNEYGEFSPWDTFRSLHPLLSLLFPDRQNEMILSMLDIYREQGRLPVETMTGDHSIPIIADSWFKGIRGFDSALAYAAMRKSIADTPYSKKDRAVYLREGYIPSSYPESVTRTMEYAYDDWALGRFAREAVRRPEEADLFSGRGNSYRNLFDPEELFFLPKKSGLAGKGQAAGFTREPGTVGYKEGDKWVYSYFAPQDGRGLINLMGGKEEFAKKLDSALSGGQILFDNETVFHIPYLFNEAGRPDKTQEWVSRIMHGRYAASPGGLPGNDDLGSMSAWYVLSAMGLYPLCPGRPYYAIGSPLFRELVIRQDKGQSFVIRAEGPEGLSGAAIRQGTAPFPYVQSMEVNHAAYHRLWISHSLIASGGEILFHMDSLRAPADRWAENGTPTFPDEARQDARIAVSKFSLSQTRLEPDEEFRIRFSLTNPGGAGTKVVRLYADGVEYGRRNIFVDEGATVTDSMSSRLYPVGTVRLRIDTLKELSVKVMPPAIDKPLSRQLAITDLVFTPMLRKGERQILRYTARNTGGYRHQFSIPVMINDTLIRTDTVSLDPGAQKELVTGLFGGAVKEGDGGGGRAGMPGWKDIRIGNAVSRFKIFDADTASLLLDLSMEPADGESWISDGSGFSNRGEIRGQDSCYPDRERNKGKKGPAPFGDCYVELPPGPSLDRMGETITMMAWVRQEERDRGYVDFFSKGDNHVLQIVGGRSLTFFAGGWGRGDCTVPLPADWLGHWHHVAGVCAGNKLYVYIDGALKGEAGVEGRVNLSVSGQWCLGRNEEFPGERIFRGRLAGVKIFSEPLGKAELGQVMGRRPPEP